MAIPSSTSVTDRSATAQAQDSQTEATKPDAGKTEGAQASTTGSIRAEVKTQLNIQIIQASLEVSINAGNDSQALLFRSAIDNLNEVLAPELGENAIQNAAKQQDNSPEATADRILKFATGMFDAYAAQHPDKDRETLANDFVDLIRGGFEKGFKEAADILDGLGVLQGDVEGGINKTYDLVQKGLDDFLTSLLPKKDGDETTEDGSAVSPPATGGNPSGTTSSDRATVKA